LKKKIAIIGGGITACACAFILNSKGYKVEIYEKTNSLGGILKDLKFNKETFLSGPQYLDKSDWIKNLFKITNFKKDFKQINLKFGSITNLFDEKTVFTKQFAHPSTNKLFTKIKKKKNKDLSLIERLGCYQSNISIPLKIWIKNFNKNFKELHVNCSVPTQISRIFFQNSKNVVSQQKKDNQFADDLLGLPNLKQYQKFFVPKKGFDDFFKKLDFYFDKQKIKIFKNKIIKINYSNKFIFLDGKNTIKADYYIWACNPVPLINASKKILLDNPSVRIITFCFDVKLKSSIQEDIYFQVFSNSNKINRIYLYKLKYKYKLNIECFFDKKLNFNEIKKITEKYLKKFGISFLKLDFQGDKKELRHILYTNNDYKTFLNFYEEFKNQNLIPGFWEEYSREKKIKKIINYFEKNKLLK